jgi:hypothetical protein
MHVLTPRQVESNILAREMAELLSEESDQQDAFVGRAQAHVMQRWRALEGINVPESATPQDLADVPVAKLGVRGSEMPSSSTFVPNVEAPAFVPRALGADAPTTPFPPDSLTVQQRVAVAAGGAPGHRERQSSELTTEDEEDGESRFYFFQSEDGQPIYLSPLNTRCLTTVRPRKHCVVELVTVVIWSMATWSAVTLLAVHC